MKKVVILSGKGELPLLFKDLAQKKGYEVYTVGVKSITDFKTDFTVPFLGFVEFENLLKELDYPYITMLGKFEPSLLLSAGQGILFIFRRFFDKNLKRNLEIFQTLREKIKIFTPKKVIETYITYMEEKGFKFLPSEEIKRITQPLLAEEGILTRGINPDKKTLQEGKVFFEYAKRIADMDIGQTLIFKEGHVIAVEGLEGTDRTIKRACKLVGEGFSVIKVGRTNQDFRIDVPTVGMETLNLLARCKVKALFLEAGNVFIVRKEEFLKRATEKGIAVIGLTPHWPF